MRLESKFKGYLFLLIWIYIISIDMGKTPILNNIIISFLVSIIPFTFLILAVGFVLFLIDF